MNRIWTGKALDSYDFIISSIIKKWGLGIAQRFIDDVKHVLSRIERSPNFYRISNSRPYLRKAKINAHNYLVYQVDGNDLILIEFGYSKSGASSSD